MSWLKLNAMYVALLLVFATAWTADRFAWLAPWMLACALAIVAAQAAVFFAGANERRVKSSKQVEVRGAKSVAAAELFFEPHAIDIHRYAKASLTRDLVLRAYRNQVHMLMLREELERRHAVLLNQEKVNHRFHGMTAELSKWTATEIGDGAFNISAGAFEITFIEGKAHIHVIDRSKVSVTASPSSDTRNLLGGEDFVFEKTIVN